uniref:Transposase IS200-like domain-containing protein n=1 Tax=Candidatus Enterococcus mansonii TaxID=1834181 RepID=A0A242CIK8_9ENTE|nr:hypothetical protein [Enterococcus sp. 4G2_DIV0659]OTO10077.1 hypothetical protein A5880_000760 [Enterococcus sp. 4G2_DIV0659]
MIVEQYSNQKYKYGVLNFGVRDTMWTGLRRNKKRIEDYIRNQLIVDKQLDLRLFKEVGIFPYWTERAYLQSNPAFLTSDADLEIVFFPLVTTFSSLP